MLKQKNESYDDYVLRMQNRADILFPSMKDKNKTKKQRNLPLGKSIYDDDDDDENEMLPMNKVKSPLEVLTDDKYNKLSEDKKDKTETAEKTSRNRTQEEEDEILDLMYPSMKNTGRNKTEESGKTDKTGMKVPETAGGSDTKQINKPEKSEEERNRDALKILGMDENEYQIKGNTISRKEKTKDYEVINNVKYPKNTDNEEIEKLKQQAKEDRSKRLKEDNTEYLKRHAKLEQFGIDHVDNPIVKLGDKAASWTNEAVENLHMSKKDSYLNTDYAKKHKVLQNYKEEPEYLHEYYQKKIPSQGRDAEKLPGILIDEKSESSQNLKKSILKDSGFIDKIKKYDNALKSGYSVNDNMDFKDKNWHNAIGKSDIVNMHVNKKGDIELDIVDIYDFNEGEKNKLVKIGRDRQDKEEIKPYFQRYHVIIPKDEYNKMMKK